MKKLAGLKIPLHTEMDILGNCEQVQVIGINQMYTGGKKQGAKGKRLTPEAVRYKNFLKQYISKFLTENKWDSDRILTQKLFFTIEFDLVIPVAKSGELDARYLRDVDNLIKPVQDALQRKKGEVGLVENDSQFRSFIPHITYNETKEKYGEIKINIYEYSPKLMQSLFKVLE